MTLRSCSLVLCLALLGCDKKDGDAGGKDDGKSAADAGKGDGKGDGKDDGKAAEAGGDEGEATLQVAEGDDNVDGPIPPEASMVLFAIEGALLPLACFDKASGAIKSGDDCLDLVKEGEKVRLDAGFSSARNKSAGGRVEPQCLAGAGKEIAIGVDSLSEANYRYGTWPPAGVRAVQLVKEETMQASALSIGDDVKAKLEAAIKKDKSSASGEIVMHQVAEIDLDGNPKQDVVYSAYIKDPRVLEQYKWSGIFLARDGNLDDLLLLETTKSLKDVFEVRATVNIDGAGPAELWLRMSFAEGGGDRLYKIEGAKAEPVGKWSCGA